MLFSGSFVRIGRIGLSVHCVFLFGDPLSGIPVTSVLYLFSLVQMAIGYLTVLSVAYPLLPVSDDSTGGAEQILALLERGLVRRGHRSLVIAAEGSVISGKLIPTPTAHGEMTEEVRREAQ